MTLNNHHQPGAWIQHYPQAPKRHQYMKAHRQQQEFPSSLPSKYCPVPILLNFGVQKWIQHVTVADNFVKRTFRFVLSGKSFLSLMKFLVIFLKNIPVVRTTWLHQEKNLLENRKETFSKKQNSVWKKIEDFFFFLFWQKKGANHWNQNYAQHVLLFFEKHLHRRMILQILTQMTFVRREFEIWISSLWTICSTFKIMLGPQKHESPNQLECTHWDRTINNNPAARLALHAHIRVRPFNK